MSLRQQWRQLISDCHADTDECGYPLGNWKLPVERQRRGGKSLPLRAIGVRLVAVGLYVGAGGRSLWTIRRLAMAPRRAGNRAGSHHESPLHSMGLCILHDNVDCILAHAIALCDEHGVGYSRSSLHADEVFRAAQRQVS